MKLIFLQIFGAFENKIWSQAILKNVWELSILFLARKISCTLLYQIKHRRAKYYLCRMRSENKTIHLVHFSRTIVDASSEMKEHNSLYCSSNNKKEKRIGIYFACYVCLLNSQLHLNLWKQSILKCTYKYFNMIAQRAFTLQ